MKIRHGNSHINKSCVVCGKQTKRSKIYEEGSISIKVPVCDRDENDCHMKFAIKDMAKNMLRQLKEEVTA